LHRVELLAQLSMSDCEWMFGDAASGAVGFTELAHLNPFRWSGPVTFEKATNDLENVLKKQGCRAILVKVPAGVTTKSERYETIQEAIAYLKEKDPAELARKQAEEKRASEAHKQDEEKRAAEAAAATARKEVATKKETVKAKDDSKAANNTANAAKSQADKVQSESDLLSWKNPVKTGTVLACLNGLFFLFYWLEGNAAPVFFSASILAILIGAAAKFAMPSLSDSPPKTLSKDSLDLVVTVAANQLNFAVSKLQDAIVWKDAASSTWVLVTLSLMRRFLSWISLSAILFLVVNAIFVLPYVLQSRKEDIDKHVVQKAKAWKDIILLKVPKYTDVVKEE